MNFMSGTKLANFQEDLLNRYRNQKVLKVGENVTVEEKALLDENMWIVMAYYLAPSNLVIRHLCLRAVLNMKPDGFFNEIMNQVKRLAPDLWVEGYSYWLYTRGALILYTKEVGGGDWIKEKIASIDDAFAETSYMSNGKLMPAPFGDLRKNNAIDTVRVKIVNDKKLKFIEKRGDRYVVKPYFVGMNTHVPSRKEDIIIVAGEPVGFDWYEGYEKKYPSQFAEWCDILNPLRILSIF